MRTYPVVLLAALLLAAAIILVLLAAQLPDRVAIHFDAAGVPNGFTTRAGAREFLLLFTLGAPIVVTLLTALLPRLLPPSMVNIPSRDYWLDAERAQDSLNFLSEQGIWFGCLLLIFLTVVDALLVRANALAPPQLPTTSFLWAMACFFAAVGVWACRLYNRFRIDDEP